MIRRINMILCVVVAATITPFANADVTISQGATAPTYSTTLNFDEPGGPTGNVTTDAFLASHGISSLGAGDGVPIVGDFTADLQGGPWVGTANSFFGNFGIFATFASDLSEFSANIWDPSGAPSPFGGGMSIFVFDDGVEVANSSVEPAWGGLGDPAINITTSGGMVFDEVRILGFGFTPTTFGDDFSWNVVPEPSTSLLIAMGGLIAILRRRS